MCTIRTGTRVHAENVKNTSMLKKQAESPSRAALNTPVAAQPKRHGGLCV